MHYFTLSSSPSDSHARHKLFSLTLSLCMRFIVYKGFIWLSCGNWFASWNWLIDIEKIFFTASKLFLMLLLDLNNVLEQPSVVLCTSCSHIPTQETSSCGDKKFILFFYFFKKKGKHIKQIQKAKEEKLKKTVILWNIRSKVNWEKFFKKKKSEAISALIYFGLLWGKQYGIFVKK